jgi:FkbM family methyltransferase
MVHDVARAVRDHLRRRGVCLRTLGVGAALREAAARLTGRQVLEEVRWCGCAHSFHVRLDSSDVPTFRQVFVKDEYGFETDRPPRTIVDAGANIGLASILFANRYPGARIVAIEPEAANFALLQANVAPYPAIIPVQAALWCTDGEIDLLDPGLGHWGYMIDPPESPEHGPARVCHRVRALTVERVIDEFGLGRLDLLKVDIEGAEREVFSDTSRWIDRVDAIIVEEHDRLKPGCSASIRKGTPDFTTQWQQGENLFLVRDGRIAPRRRLVRRPFATRHRPRP